MNEDAGERREMKRQPEGEDRATVWPTRGLAAAAGGWNVRRQGRCRCAVWHSLRLEKL